MDYYAGIDVSLEWSNVCVVDASGKIVREGKVASDVEALIGYFGSHGLSLSRIGLEAGPLSQWLYAAIKQAGLAVELLETRHVRDAFKAMPVKSDRNDARGIAQLMRLGWFRPVHCKSMAAQELRAMLAARRRRDDAIGIDLPRPVTEARIERQRNPGTACELNRRSPDFTSFNPSYGSFHSAPARAGRRLPRGSAPSRSFPVRRIARTRYP